VPPTPSAPLPEPDLHTTAGRLEVLLQRLESARAGSAPAVAKQRAKGKGTARERIEALVDEGSFVETDALVRSRAAPGAAPGPDGDGVIAGHGTVDGRTVCVYAQDFTVVGGSLGEQHGGKITKVMDLALRIGAPVVGINDSGGARIQEGVDSLGAYGQIFRRNVAASGVVPQISLIMGPCAGGAVYSPAVTDLVVMVDATSHMFVTGPDVIRTVTGEDVGMEELGGARTHNAVSGAAHHLAATEADAIAYVKEVLAHLPSNNLSEAPVLSPLDDRDPLETTPEDLELDALVPDSPNQPYDMHLVLRHVLDDGDFLEVHELFAPNIVVGFGRVEGHSVGVVANQPTALAGTLDIDASEKAARFVRLCDAFGVPVLTFVDVPGFLPGTEQEYGGIIRRGAKLLYAYAEATVPTVTVITRKAYGGAYIVMGSKHLGADVNLAWPSAQIAVMGAQGAVNILHRGTLAAAAEQGEDVEAVRAGLVDEYETTMATPYLAAERGYVDAVIAPSQTRGAVVRALRSLRTKRDSLPPKKHGNIPL
jgi:propionyl-CoA carboxylase beta chain